MTTITATQNVNQVNLTATQSGVSVSLQPVIIVDGDAGATSFLALTDTPVTYTDQAGKVVKVNATEDGLEFDDPTSAVPTLQEVTDEGNVTTNDVSVKTLTISQFGGIFKIESISSNLRILSVLNPSLGIINDTNGFGFGNGSNFATLRQNLITANRTYTLPDKDGTFAMLDDIPSGGVDSVNGQTGVVVLDADDIDDSATTNKFATAAELAQIATNESDITTLEGNRLLEVQAGSNITVDNTDPLRPIVSSSGGGGATKQKQVIQIQNEWRDTAYPNWTTFNAGTLYFFPTANAVNDDGSGTPLVTQSQSGIMIPKGYKVNKITWNHLVTSSGEFEILCLLGKPSDTTGDGYEVFANGDFQGLGSSNYSSKMNLFELYRDLFYNNSVNPFTAANSTQYKRELILDNTGGVNEAADNDAQLMIFLRRIESPELAFRVRFVASIEIEEI